MRKFAPKAHRRRLFFFPTRGRRDTFPVVAEDGQVLIVEDDDRTARSLARLVSCEAPVRVAGSVAEGKHVVRSSSHLAAVLLDYRLPDGTGLEIIDMLRPGVPVLILTGTDDPGVPNRVMAKGAQFATKPLERGDLLSFVRRALRPPADPAVEARLPSYLTHRQREIASLLVAGLTRAEVAARLGVAESTIKSAVQVICRKCSVDSIRELRISLLNRSH